MKEYMKVPIILKSITNFGTINTEIRFSISLEKTNMFHYMQKALKQRGISVESPEFHINTILWKFQVPHYLCRSRIPTVELECNLCGTESHSIRLWKKMWN